MESCDDLLEMARVRAARLERAHSHAAKGYADRRIHRLYEELPSHLKDPTPYHMRIAVADAFEAGKREARKRRSVS